ARALEVGQRTADVRMLDPAAEQPAGLHHLVAGVVDRRGRVVDAANQRELVGVRGHLGEDFGDSYARYIGVNGLERPAYLFGRVGLGVEGVYMAGAADEEQHDAIDVGVLDSAGGLAGEKAGQRQAERGDRPSMEEVTPGQAVTKGHGSVGVQS